MTELHEAPENLSAAATVMDEVESVQWKGASNTPAQEIVISGTVILVTALKLAYKYFTAKNKEITFHITKIHPDGRRVDFTYTGPKDKEFVESLIRAGYELSFSGASSAL